MYQREMYPFRLPGNQYIKKPHLFSVHSAASALRQTKKLTTQRTQGAQR